MKYMNKTKQIVSLLIFTLVFTGLLMPLTTIAQAPIDTQSGGSGQFIPCSGTSCSACDLVKLANAIVTWLIAFVGILFAVLMVVAGFRLVTSGGNQSALASAKSMLTNALIGFLLILGAWLLVDTLMRALLGDSGEITGYGPWSQIQCWEQNVPRIVEFEADTQVVDFSELSRDASDGGNAAGTSNTLVTGTLSNAEALEFLRGGGRKFIIVTSGNCSDKNNPRCTSLDGVRELTITRTIELYDAVGSKLYITGGTETGHASGPHSHGNGYKIDFRYTPGDALDKHIRANFRSIGGNKWRDGNGNIYWLHGPNLHWDVLFTN